LDSLKEIQASLIQWGKENYRTFPWRNTENLFHALIAEVMLQRTRAEQVEAIYRSFVELMPSLESEFSEEKLREILKPLGLNWRIEKIIELIKVLKIKKEVPSSYDELVALPGVGDYAASAFLSFHQNKRKPLIDSNAVRLWSRVFGLKAGPGSRRNREFRTIIDRVTPSSEFKEFNYAVLDLSRMICTSKPLCSLCPIGNYCKFKVVENDSGNII